MNRLDVCPKSPAIRDYLLGLVEEKQAGEIDCHLRSCRHCLDTVEALSASDTFTDALRAGVKPPVEDESEEVRSLVERFHREGPPAPDTIYPSMAESVVQDASTVPNERDFLSPPLRPDEIGRLGGYRVLRKLGAGGMGIVLLAEDPLLNRKVALKVLRPSLAAQDENRQRFRREAQAAAQLSHDHIVTVHQVGEDGDVPYFAMQLLEGESLEDHLQRLAKTGATMPLGEAVRIGREIAEGLAAAHERGLIHRDVKPANIWLEAPRGRVKLLDFGLALPTECEGKLTQSGMLLGTPRYMAPERIERGAVGVDHRSDLFSLGCVLYQMTTGRPPFEAPTLYATLRAVAECEPTAAKSLNPTIPENLSALIASLLQKDPARRPGTARQAATELEGMGQESPLPQRVEQREPRRPRTSRLRLAALAAGLLLLLVAGIVLRLTGDKGTLIVESDDPDVEVVVLKGGKEVKILDPKSEQEIRLWSGSYEVELRKGKETNKLETRDFELKRDGRRVVRVTRVPPGPTPAVVATTGKPIRPGALVANPVKVAGVDSWAVVPTDFSPMLSQDFGPCTFCFSPDGRFLAGVDRHAIRVWDSSSMRQVKAFVAPTLRAGESGSLAWSRNGKRLAFTWWINPDVGGAEVWEVDTGRLLCRHRTGGASGLAWNPAGDRLALGVKDVVEILDVASGELYDRLANDGKEVKVLAWSPRGDRLVSLSSRGVRIKVWDREGKEIGTHDGRPEPNVEASPAHAVWSGDGKYLAVSTGAETCVYDAADMKRRAKLAAGDGGCFAWLPDNTTLAAGGRFWDAMTGKVLREIHDERRRRVLPEEEQFPNRNALAWSLDGKKAVTNDNVGFYLWDTDAGKRALFTKWNGGIFPVREFSPDRQWVVVPFHKGGCLLETATGKRAASWSSELNMSAVAWSPRSDQFACCHLNRGSSGWKGGNIPGMPLFRPGVIGDFVCFAPDGKRVAVTGINGGGVEVLDPDSKTPLVLDGSKGAMFGEVAWSPDGKTVAAGGPDMTVHFWDASGQKRPFVWRAKGRDLNWSPDGKLLYSAGKVLDVSSGKEVGSFDSWWAMARWSPDGKTLDLFEVEPHVHEIHTYDVATGKWLAKRARKPCSHVYLLHSGKFLVVTPEGYYRGSPENIDREIVYVALIDGRQETFTPEAFAKKFGWKNDPDKVRLKEEW